MKKSLAVVVSKPLPTVPLDADVGRIVGLNVRRIRPLPENRQYRERARQGRVHAVHAKGAALPMRNPGCEVAYLIYRDEVLARAIQKQCDMYAKRDENQGVNGSG